MRNNFKTPYRKNILCHSKVCIRATATLLFILYTTACGSSDDEIKETARDNKITESEIKEAYTEYAAVIDSVFQSKRGDLIFTFFGESVDEFINPSKLTDIII